MVQSIYYHITIPIHSAAHTWCWRGNGSSGVHHKGPAQLTGGVAPRLHLLCVAVVHSAPHGVQEGGAHGEQGVLRETPETQSPQSERIVVVHCPAVRGGRDLDSRDRVEVDEGHLDQRTVYRQGEDDWRRGCRWGWAANRNIWMSKTKRAYMWA